MDLSVPPPFSGAPPLKAMRACLYNHSDMNIETRIWRQPNCPTLISFFGSTARLSPMYTKYWRQPAHFLNCSTAQLLILLAAQLLISPSMHPFLPPCTTLSLLIRQSTTAMIVCLLHLCRQLHQVQNPGVSCGANDPAYHPGSVSVTSG